MNRFFVVCDQEHAYVERLTSALGGRLHLPYPIEGMTSIEELHAFCKTHHAAILLIEESLADAQNALPDADCVLKLSGTPQEHVSDAVFKYQPVETLLQQVLAKAADAGTKDVPPAGRRTQLLGVYTPVRCGDTTPFALALGQILAKKQRVLYLNFCALTGLAGLFGKTECADLSDILYLIAQGKWDVQEWKRQCMQTVQNMDYILPVVSPDDLHCLREQSLYKLLQTFLKSDLYETIVLEIGAECEDFLAVLAACDAIYMPVQDDAVARAQLLQYEQLLMQNGYGDVRKKTIQVKPPFYKAADGSRFFKQLIWGELGDYVRSLLWGGA